MSDPEPIHISPSPSTPALSPVPELDFPSQPDFPPEPDFLPDLDYFFGPDLLREPDVLPEPDIRLGLNPSSPVTPSLFPSPGPYYLPALTPSPKTSSMLPTPGQSIAATASTAAPSVISHPTLGAPAPAPLPQIHQFPGFVSRVVIPQHTLRPRAFSEPIELALEAADLRSRKRIAWEAQEDCELALSDEGVDEEVDGRGRRKRRRVERELGEEEKERTGLDQLLSALENLDEESRDLLGQAVETMRETKEQGKTKAKERGKGKVKRGRARR